MKGRVWINFKELRAQLKFEDVLRHYKVKVERKGDQHQGSCPLPQHPKEMTGLSFSANLDRGIFQCFGCGAKGNVLEFAAFMSGVDAEDGIAFRKVAVELQTRFCPEGASTRTNAKPASATKPTIANAPLDFALKDLEAGHPWLIDAGLTPATIGHFGLGHCSRGMLKGQIAIPLHNGTGELVGYAGQPIADTLLDDNSSKYSFPADRERKGTALAFTKSLLLYNNHRIKGPCEDLIVVEWFPSAWWLHQHDYSNVVATMGQEASAEQIQQMLALLHPCGHLWLMPEGTDASSKWAEDLAANMSQHRFVRWLNIGSGNKPTSLSGKQLPLFFSS